MEETAALADVLHFEESLKPREEVLEGGRDPAQTYFAAPRVPGLLEVMSFAAP